MRKRKKVETERRDGEKSGDWEGREIGRRGGDWEE